MCAPIEPVKPSVKCSPERLQRARNKVLKHSNEIDKKEEPSTEMDVAGVEKTGDIEAK